MRFTIIALVWPTEGRADWHGSCPPAGRAFALQEPCQKGLRNECFKTGIYAAVRDDRRIRVCAGRTAEPCGYAEVRRRGVKN